MTCYHTKFPYSVTGVRIWSLCRIAFPVATRFALVHCQQMSWYELSLEAATTVYGLQYCACFNTRCMWQKYTVVHTCYRHINWCTCSRSPVQAAKSPAKFKVLTAVLMKIRVFWGVCAVSTGSYRRFGVVQCLLQNRAVQRRQPVPQNPKLPTAYFILPSFTSPHLLFIITICATRNVFYYRKIRSLLKSYRYTILGHVRPVPAFMCCARPYSISV